MRIALIAPTYLPARRANTVQVMKMAQAFTELGHETLLLVPGKTPSAPSWSSLSRQYGLRVEFPVVWLPALPSLRSYDFGLAAVWKARQWNAHLVYTRHPQSAAFASLGALPTILEIHDLPRGRLAPLLLRSFLRGPGKRRMVVITHALATDLARTFEISSAPPFCLIAPDGVDLERYTRLPQPFEARWQLHNAGLLPELKPENFTAGYSGHLYAGRGSELILDLAARLPQVAFLLAGGEPQDVERVQRQAHSAALGNVFLAGFVPNAELPLYQAACDVLLMPYQARVAASSGGDISRYLSPMKLFEYLACQRPILSSDLPVLREVLNEEIAILLPASDPQAWADALQSLIEHPHHGRRLAEAAFSQASQFTWKSRASRILDGLGASLALTSGDRA